MNNNKEAQTLRPETVAPGSKDPGIRAAVPWTSQLRRMDTVVSTQEEAKALAEAGLPEGTAVQAECQTGGRGRRGRPWHSPAGKGIWMSVVLRPPLPLAATPQLTLLTGVAVCRAVRRVSGVEAGIKWPNDLLAGGRKICGILLESALREGRLAYTIAGIGIDVNLAEEDIPPELRERATSLLLERGGRPVDRQQLAGAVLEELEQLYDGYLKEGFGEARAAWEAMSVTLGRQIAAQCGEERVTGVAVGLSPEGSLLVRDDAGSIVTIHSGEIEMI